MELPVAFYTTAIIAILITGVSKSGFGGGLGVMAVPMMSLFAAPQVAAAVMMPILFAMDVIIVIRYRRNWNRSVVLALLPGALLGLLLGAVSFGALNADLVRFVIGLFALVFVLQFLLQGRKRGNTHRASRLVVWALGATSGFASYIAHAGGPPVKGYLLAQNMPKTEFVGTNTIFFFVLNGLKTIAYGSTGTLDLDTLYISLSIAPCLLIGVGLGIWLHEKVEQRLFVGIVYGFLALTALRLLWTSIPVMMA